MCKISKNLKKIEELKNKVLCLESEIEEFENADVLVKENSDKIVELQKILIEQLEGKIDFLNEKIDKLKQVKTSIGELIKQREIILELTGLLDVLTKNVKVKEFYEKTIYDIKENRQCQSESPEVMPYVSESGEGEEQIDRAIRRIEENAIEDAENVLKEVKTELTQNITSIEETTDKINEEFESAYLELNNLKKDAEAKDDKTVDYSDSDLDDKNFDDEELREIENSTIKGNDKIESILSEVDKIGIEIEKDYSLLNEINSIEKDYSPLNEIKNGESEFIKKNIQSKNETGDKSSATKKQLVDGLDISGDSLSDFDAIINNGELEKELKNIEKEIESGSDEIDSEETEESNSKVTNENIEKIDIEKMIENELEELNNIDSEKLFDDIKENNLL
ncbi:MAG TPA: hypothetical protein PKY81_10900 [bacterium]|nr:hypothetical protein [bacterium]HPN31457.1 hypothetical protein [bacterium]